MPLSAVKYAKAMKMEVLQILKQVTDWYLSKGPIILSYFLRKVRLHVELFMMVSLSLTARSAILQATMLGKKTAHQRTLKLILQHFIHTKTVCLTFIHVKSMLMRTPSIQLNMDISGARLRMLNLKSWLEKLRKHHMQERQSFCAKIYQIFDRTGKRSMWQL